MKIQRFLPCLVIVALLAVLPGVASSAPAGKILTCRDWGRLTPVAGQTGDGDSLNWVDTGEGFNSITFCYFYDSGLATTTIFLSIDGGEHWDDVENTQFGGGTAQECVSITYPTGMYKAVVTSSAAPVEHILFRCGPRTGR